MEEGGDDGKEASIGGSSSEGSLCLFGIRRYLKWPLLIPLSVYSMLLNALDLLQYVGTWYAFAAINFLLLVRKLFVYTYISCQDFA